MLGPFTLRFHNARMEKLANRVICLAGTAMVLVVLRSACFFMTKWNVPQEFHADSTSVGQVQSLNSPAGMIGFGIFTMLLSLVVPCCGYLGAKNNNRSCVCCFAWCNCLGGCLQLLYCMLIILFFAVLGVMQETCKPLPGVPVEQQKCPGIVKGCESMNSPDYDLSKYEGCYDYMVEMLPAMYAGLGIVLGFSCCVMSLQCASCYWGRDLYTELDREDLCIGSDSDGP